MASTAPAGPRPASAGHLVGRGHDVATVADVLGSDPRRSCLLVGRPGVGTTALAAEVAVRMRAEGLLVSWFDAARPDHVEPRGIVVADDIGGYGLAAAAAIEQLSFDPGVRLLATARQLDGAVPPLAATLLRSPDVLRHQVEPLGSLECAEFAQLSLGGERSRFSGSRLRRLTGGRPTWLLELLGSPDRCGRWDDGSWRPTWGAAQQLLTARRGRPRWNALGPAARAVVADVVRSRVVALADVVEEFGTSAVRAAESTELVVARVGTSPDVEALLVVPPLLVPGPWVDAVSVAEWASAACDRVRPTAPSRAGPLRELTEAVAKRVDVVYRLTDRGRLDDATSAARDLAIADVARLGLPSAVRQHVVFGRMSLLAGHAATALGAFLDAVESSGPEDVAVDCRLAAAGAAVALCWLADLDAARYWANDYDDRRRAAGAPPDVVGDRWRATYDTFAGNFDAAVARLEALLDQADATDHPEAVVAIAFDLARLGRRVSPDILTRTNAGWPADDALGWALFGFVERANAGDLHGVMSVAERFELVGAGRHAIEAWAYGAMLADAAGDTGSRLACARRVNRLRRRDIGGWVCAPDALRQGRCSPRELEVAALAAGGVARRDIAARLFISPKTVDRHLGSVYAILGIASRRDLPDALEALDGA